MRGLARSFLGPFGAGSNQSSRPRANARGLHSLRASGAYEPEFFAQRNSDLLNSRRGFLQI